MMLWMAAREASDSHTVFCPCGSVSRKIVEEKHNHGLALKSTGDKGLSQSGNGNKKASSEPLRRPPWRPGAGGCERPWDTARPEAAEVPAEERTRWSHRKACLFLLTLLFPFCSRKYKWEGPLGHQGRPGMASREGAGWWLGRRVAPVPEGVAGTAPSRALAAASRGVGREAVLSAAVGPREIVEFSDWGSASRRGLDVEDRCPLSLYLSALQIRCRQVPQPC